MARPTGRARGAELRGATKNRAGRDAFQMTSNGRSISVTAASVHLSIQTAAGAMKPASSSFIIRRHSLLVVCTSVFLFFVNLDFRGKSKQIALHSTGVFVIHGFFLSIFRKIPGFDGTVLTAVVIMSSILASFVLITVNKRVKFIL